MGAAADAFHAEGPRAGFASVTRAALLEADVARQARRREFLLLRAAVRDGREGAAAAAASGLRNSCDAAHHRPGVQDVAGDDARRVGCRDVLADDLLPPSGMFRVGDDTARAKAVELS